MWLPEASPTETDASAAETVVELLSHALILYAAVVLWLVRRYFAATLASAVLVNSVIYHACRGSLYCFGLTLTTSRMLDYTTANYAFPGAVLEIFYGYDGDLAPLAVVPRIVMVFTVVYAVLAYPFQPMALLVVFTVLAMVLTGLFFFSASPILALANRVNTALLVAALANCAVGLGLFFFDGGAQAYAIQHPIWHMCIGAAFLLIVLAFSKDHLRCVMNCARGRCCGCIRPIESDWTTEETAL